MCFCYIHFKHSLFSTSDVLLERGAPGPIHNLLHSDPGVVLLGESLGGRDIRGWLAVTATDSDDFTSHKYTQLNCSEMNPQLKVSLAESSKCQSLWSHPTPGKGWWKGTWSRKRQSLHWSTSVTWTHEHINLWSPVRSAEGPVPAGEPEASASRVSQKTHQQPYQDPRQVALEAPLFTGNQTDSHKPSVSRAITRQCNVLP